MALIFVASFPRRAVLEVSPEIFKPLDSNPGLLGEKHEY